METLIQILTWLGLAFLAGFVGQFGKSLTQKILLRRRTRRAAAESGPSVEDTLSGKAVKLEKKRTKAELKRTKKSEGGDDGPRRR